MERITGLVARVGVGIAEKRGGGVMGKDWCVFVVILPFTDSTKLRGRSEKCCVRQDGVEAEGQGHNEFACLLGSERGQGY